MVGLKDKEMYTISDNKRIAKNTILLYVRQFVTMIVTLYTSRVILQVLGVSDFGLFDVICGTVTLFAFVNGSMSGCTQRFLSFALGKNDTKISSITFSVALQLHTILSIVFLILMEGIGFILLNYVLNIPAGREGTAFFIYNISLVTFCVNFLYVPFEAAIIAHEKMDFYAYLSIFDVVAKLGVVYLLKFFPEIDSLKLYTVLLLMVSISLFSIYSFYCCHKFEMCSFKILFDKKMMKEMSAYTFWNTLGHISYIVSTQGYNIIFNIFWGTTINAARGIAVQVSGAVGKFTQNFQLAFYPQIVKLYAAEERNKMLNLVMNASVYSFYLVLFFGVPLFFGIDLILDIWLVEVPEYTSIFVKVLLIQILISSLDVSIDRAIVATGRVKSMNLVNTCNQLSFLALSYGLLKAGLDIMVVLPIMVAPTVVLYLYTLHLMKKYLQLDFSIYINDVIIKCIKALLLASIVPIFISLVCPPNLMWSILVICISALTTTIAIMVELGRKTRAKLFGFIKNKIKK